MKIFLAFSKKVLSIIKFAISKINKNSFEPSLKSKNLMVIQKKQKRDFLEEFSR